MEDFTFVKEFLGPTSNQSCADDNANLTVNDGDNIICEESNQNKIEEDASFDHHHKDQRVQLERGVSREPDAKMLKLEPETESFHFYPDMFSVFSGHHNSLKHIFR